VTNLVKCRRHNVELHNFSDILFIALRPYVSTISCIDRELQVKQKEILTIEVQVLFTCSLLENLRGTTKMGHAVAPLVEALRYMPEGRGFNSRWYH
jgi:hypothetical protein